MKSISHAEQQIAAYIPFLSTIVGRKIHGFPLWEGRAGIFKQQFQFGNKLEQTIDGGVITLYNRNGSASLDGNAGAWGCGGPGGTMAKNTTYIFQTTRKY